MADEEGAAPTETTENVEEPAATPADAQEAPAEATPDDEAAPEDAPAAEEGAEPVAPAETDVDAGTPKPDEEAPPEDAGESGDAEAPKEDGEEIAPVDEEAKEEGNEEAGEPVEGSGGAGTPGDKAPEAEAEDGGEGEQPPAEQEADGEVKEGDAGDAAEKEATPVPPGEDDKPEEPTEDDQVPVGSPPPDEGATEDTDMFEPGTPPHEPESVMLLEEAEEEEVIPEYNREELIEKYHAALQEREILNQKNHQLQHKLAEYFKRKKTEDTRQEVDRNVTDQEQRYLKYMSNLEELRQQEAAERDHYNEHIEEMKDRKAAKQALVEQEWGQYSDFKRSVALASVNSRTGRTLTAKEFEIYELNEVKKEAEVSQVRLENIKLRNRLRKRELQLKQKEELAEGLHLIDFEQLKIENQTYNEKIEERNEELMKLRKKITSTVQVLTHLKEKLQFVQAENHVAKQELGQIEAEVAGKRDILSRTKQARDALRHDNGKLQQKCGLLGNHLLLRDYEDSTDDIDDLRHRLDHLKRSHAELTLSISGVKKKIEQARAQNQS